MSNNKARRKTAPGGSLPTEQYPTPRRANKSRRRGRARGRGISIHDIDLSEFTGSPAEPATLRNSIIEHRVPMTSLAKRADILESLAQDVLGVILNSVTGIDEAEIQRQWEKYYLYKKNTFTERNFISVNDLLRGQRPSSETARAIAQGVRISNLATFAYIVQQQRLTVETLGAVPADLDLKDAWRVFLTHIIPADAKIRRKHINYLVDLATHVYNTHQYKIRSPRAQVDAFSEAKDELFNWEGTVSSTGVDRSRLSTKLRSCFEKHASERIMVLLRTPVPGLNEVQPFDAFRVSTMELVQRFYEDVSGAAEDVQDEDEVGGQGQQDILFDSESSALPSSVNDDLQVDAEMGDETYMDQISGVYTEQLQQSVPSAANFINEAPLHSTPNQSRVQKSLSQRVLSQSNTATPGTSQTLNLEHHLDHQRRVSQGLPFDASHLFSEDASEKTVQQAPPTTQATPQPSSSTERSTRKKKTHRGVLSNSVLDSMADFLSSSPRPSAAPPQLPIPPRLKQTMRSSMPPPVAAPESSQDDRAFRRASLQTTSAANVPTPLRAEIGGPAGLDLSIAEDAEEGDVDDKEDDVDMNEGDDNEEVEEDEKEDEDIADEKEDEEAEDGEEDEKEDEEDEDGKEDEKDDESEEEEVEGEEKVDDDASDVFEDVAENPELSRLHEPASAEVSMYVNPSLSMLDGESRSDESVSSRQDNDLRSAEEHIDEVFAQEQEYHMQHGEPDESKKRTEEEEKERQRVALEEEERRPRLEAEEMQRRKEVEEPRHEAEETQPLEVVEKQQVEADDRQERLDAEHRQQQEAAATEAEQQPLNEEQAVATHREQPIQQEAAATEAEQQPLNEEHAVATHREQPIQQEAAATEAEQQPLNEEHAVATRREQPIQQEAEAAGQPQDTATAQDPSSHAHVSASSQGDTPLPLMNDYDMDDEDVEAPSAAQPTRPYYEDNFEPNMFFDQHEVVVDDAESENEGLGRQPSVMSWDNGENEQPKSPLSKILTRKGVRLSKGGSTNRRTSRRDKGAYDSDEDEASDRQSSVQPSRSSVAHNAVDTVQEQQQEPAQEARDEEPLLTASQIKQSPRMRRWEPAEGPIELSSDEEEEEETTPRPSLLGGWRPPSQNDAPSTSDRRASHSSRSASNVPSRQREQERRRSSSIRNGLTPRASYRDGRAPRPSQASGRVIRGHERMAQIMARAAGIDINKENNENTTSKASRKSTSKVNYDDESYTSGNEENDSEADRTLPSRGQTQQKLPNSQRLRFGLKDNTQQPSNQQTKHTKVPAEKREVLPNGRRVKVPMEDYEAELIQLWMFNKYREQRRALRNNKYPYNDGLEHEYAVLPYGFYVQMLDDHGFGGEYSQFLKRRDNVDLKDYVRTINSQRIKNRLPLHPAMRKTAGAYNLDDKEDFFADTDDDSRIVTQAQLKRDIVNRYPHVLNRGLHRGSAEPQRQVSTHPKKRLREDQEDVREESSTPKRARAESVSQQSSRSESLPSPDKAMRETIDKGGSEQPIFEDQDEEDEQREEEGQQPEADNGGEYAEEEMDQLETS